MLWMVRVRLGVGFESTDGKRETLWRTSRLPGNCRNLSTERGNTDVCMATIAGSRFKRLAKQDAPLTRFQISIYLGAQLRHPRRWCSIRASLPTVSRTGIRWKPDFPSTPFGCDRSGVGPCNAEHGKTVCESKSSLLASTTLTFVTRWQSVERYICISASDGQKSWDKRDFH